MQMVATMADIQAVIQTAPQSREQARNKRWQDESTCWKFLELASERLRKKWAEVKAQGIPSKIVEAEARLNDFKQTLDYWMLDFAGLADRTRSVIVSSFTAKSTGLTRSPLFQLFCRESTIDIVEATRSGKVVFINLPVKRYAELGRFAQVLIKTVWQRGIERNPDQAHPVFLWADEAQFFVTREDVPFQTTARSAGCATVYLTQSISNYHTAMGGSAAEAATNSLLGNLATKIFHANGDPSTNAWAQSLFGQDKIAMASQGSNSDGKMNWGTNDSMQPIVPVSKFTRLKKGSVANSGIVEA